MVLLASFEWAKVVVCVDYFTAFGGGLRGADAFCARQRHSGVGVDAWQWAAESTSAAVLLNWELGRWTILRWNILR